MKEYDLIVVGELNVDLILNNIEKAPEVGKEVFARDMTLTLGSSSAILANNISILGTKTTFLGMIGDDSYASLVVDSLQKSGVNTGHIIQTKNDKTGITVAMNYAEERAMITYPGAMSRLSAEMVSDDLLAKAKHLHVSSIFLQEALLPTVHLLFQRAKSLGLTTSLDPQWDPHENWDVNLEELLPYVDIFLPNEAELMAMTRSTSIEAGMRHIRPFTNHVVVKKGVDGAILYTSNEVIDLPAFLNQHLVDAIGAGDSFNAGFIHAFIKGHPLTKCLKSGTIMGAVNTTAEGGTGAFLSLEAVQQAAKTHFDLDYSALINEH